MKKVLLIPIYLVIAIVFCKSQNSNTIDSLLIESVMLIKKKKNEDALNLTRQLQVLTQKEKDKFRLGQSHLYAGIALKNMNDLYASLKEYNNAYKIFELIENQERKAAVLGNIANVYLSLGMLSEGISNAKKSIETWEKDTLKHASKIVASYNNMANMYFDLSKIDSSILCNRKAIATFENNAQNADSSYLANAYLSLGRRLGVSGEYEKAKQSFLIAQKIYHQLEDAFSEAETFEDIGLISMEVNDFETTQTSFEKAEKTYLEYHDSSSLANLYFNWALLNLQTNDISNADKKIQLASICAQSESTELRQLIKVTSDEIVVRANNNQLWTTILCFLGLFLTIILSFLFYLWQKRKKALQQKEQRIETEKELLEKRVALVKSQKELLEEQQKLMNKDEEMLELKKAVDRLRHTKVKNQAEIIKNIIRAIDDEKHKELLEKAAVFVDYLIHIGEIPWEQIETYNKFSEPKELKNYAEEMLWRARLLSEVDVTLEGEFDEFGDLLVKPRVQSELSEIVENAFINICKYAKCKHPKLIFEIDDLDEMLIEISDTGQGFDVNKVREGAQGLKDMETSANNLGGTFHIHSVIDEGTTIKVKIPNPFVE